MNALKLHPADPASPMGVTGFEELLTLEQAAARLGFDRGRTAAQAVRSVRWLIRTKRLSALRLNWRCWRVRPAEIERYLKECGG